MTLVNTQANKESRNDLQTLLLVLSLHSGAAKLQKECVLAAINKTSTGIVRLIEFKNHDTDMNGMNSLLLNIIGVMYRGLGYPYRSRDLHELALDFYRKDVKNNGESIDSGRGNEKILGKASTFHKLGIIYRYLGDLSSAQSAHETSLELLQELFGVHHAYISGSLLNLAVVYSRQGKFNEALQLHNRSLGIIRQIYGPRHANVGRLLNTIGTVYYRLEALNFLGFMYRDQGNLEKAQKYLERSVSIKEKVFDSDHFIVGEALNDLGVVYTRLGEARKAQMVLQRALTIFIQTWGEKHTSVATTLNSLGASYSALGEPHEAIPLHKKALETLLSMSTGTNVEHSVAETRHLLGNAYLALGNLEDARLMYRLSYSGFRKLYDSGHWRIQGVLNSLKLVESVLNKTCDPKASLFAITVISLLQDQQLLRQVNKNEDNDQQATIGLQRIRTA
ncbi:hypothetical protein ACROYT_G016309 [Oculina patagonica]